MEQRTLAESEAAEFEEFKRRRREMEIELTLKKLQVDASRREVDRHALHSACELSKKLNAYALVVSPVNVSYARRRMGESSVLLACTVGGTGESLIPVKKKEAKRAYRQGARVIRLIPCYSALLSGNASYLKREVKKLRKATKKCTLVLSLDDHALSREEIGLGITAAIGGKADAVSVRGEAELVVEAVKKSAGRVRVEASGVQNAEQLRMLLRAGAEHAATGCGEEISEELYGFVHKDPDIKTGAPNGEIAKKNETAR